jgi:glucosamine--fructose-6-phosphate aminotransferase (isomerizing)
LIIGARRGSPLVLGIGEGEMFICSDATALLPYTQKVVYLKDFDLVQIRETNFSIETLHEGESSYEIKELDFAPEAAEKGDFPHFMLKEIYEQPQAIENAIRGRLNEEESSAQLGGLNLTPQQLREIDRVIILGCGTALHAGMVGSHMLEDMAFIPTQTDYASEFRYKNCPVPKNTLFFVISQSGETADTLGAMREARRKGFRALGICNNVGSTIARESDGGVYMHAGPEIGVAATKSFLSQCAIFGLLTLVLGRMRHMSAGTGKEIIEAFHKLPAQITKILQSNELIEAVAHKYCHSKSMLFLGREYNYPVALEAALKMKEISYIHAAGFPTAELKHGVIALIDEETPCVFICPQDILHEKNISNMQEVRARKGPIIAVATDGDTDIRDHADDILFVPKTIDMLQPILNIIPLQLLAYYTAVALGRDVDKPRNLAKSVTVE